MNDTLPQAAPQPPAAEVAHARTRRRTRNVLIVFTILWVLALLPAFGFALMFPFAFDQGATPQATRIALGLIGMPFTFIFSLALMWGLFLLKKYRAALVAIVVPVIYLVAFVAVT